MRIAYAGRVFDCAEGETVLAALARGGVTVPSSCRAGLCQSCLMRAVEGTPPKAAQKGLKETWAAQGYFLACSCVPEGDLAVALPDAAAISVRARVVDKTFLSESVVRLRLEPAAAFEYRAGQYVSLVREDGLARPYSLASVPETDALLEVHVRRTPGGRMSGWIFDALAEGDSLDVRGPAGSCFYVPGREDQPMLLIGTGTGLAPLYGIARDALGRGHRGPIALYHGAVEAGGLYLVDALRALALERESLSYTPCVLRGAPPPGAALGPIDAAALGDHPDLRGRRVFLCGDPGLVNDLKKKAFLAGASIRDIHADPFLVAAA